MNGAEPMSDDEGLDINKVIEQSAKRTTLSDLARKGIQRVKVLDERAIQDLIRQAVEKVIASKTGLLAEEERTKIVSDSRRELDRLLREHNEMRSRADLLEAGKNDLVQQVENLQRQLQLQRKLEEENLRKRYQEGTAALQAQVQELQERHDAAQRELKSLRNEVNRRLAEQTALQEEMERSRGELAAAQEKAREAEAQLKNAGQIDAKLASLQQSLEQKLQQAQDSSLAAKLESLASKDTETAAKLERLFARMTDSLGKKIGSIRAGAPEGPEYRPGELMLESLFSQELESNLRSIDAGVKTEESSGGKMEDALAKLRAMRPGGGGGESKEKK